MKIHSFVFVRFLLFLLLLFLPQSFADLNSDKQALLDFASTLYHGRKVNWDPSTSVCTSWTGITCTPDGYRVLTVRLPGARLIGPIPANTLGKLDALNTLSLRSNHLSGNLPSDILSLPSLHLVYLQHNNFSGIIPSSLSPRLNNLDLSYNSFTGNIPASIQNLTHLSGLNLQNNSLSGSIPDLNLPKLKYLNLSYNHLTGSASVQFPLRFLLPPLTHHLHLTIPQKPKGSNKKLRKGIIVAIAIGGFLFILFLIMALCCLKRKGREGSGALQGNVGKSEKPREDFGSGIQEAEKNKLVFFEACSYNFDLEDLLRASAEVLGKGSYGTTYKAILEEGMTVVVKRLKEVVIGKKEFEQRMETVRRLGQHPNVIPLRAYYYSKDEKLMVYDYMTAGNLSRLLHGNMEAEGTPLDWRSRVKILLGAANGVAHIHSESGGKSIHGNIKSSNILLTEDLQGYISDFGLTPLMGFPVPSRSPGYRAPELFETQKFTQKSDVYSFGVLLLEMLTGKAAIQSGHDDVDDLPKWVQSVVREEWTAEVFDIKLMSYSSMEEELVQMLQLAMACVNTVPEMRPSMEEVVTMMEEIRPSDSGNSPSSAEIYKNVID
ncbi:Receptor-like kinase [Quillaja saponaria]|uniref:Receptor-like kinase n=1 Tax=Quillaja saponaria TaxID=32244 RepID=A0AAD7LMX5_QUISA|nr:Receptor-like kinase [Quillaja saponaria]